MRSNTTAGVYMLDRAHADALERLASHSAFAELIGVPQSPRAGVGTEIVERATAERAAGAAHWTVVVDHGVVKGIASVIGPYEGEPRIIIWIDPDARRNGYGALALRLTLDFAFRNLQRQSVHVLAPHGDVAVARMLESVGFSAGASSAPNAIRFVLTRTDWIAARDRPALAKLHPDLRAILDAELAAGNEVLETGGGWPDADSVFVRLRDPFRTKPASLSDGVVYTEPNDPHWWRADYTSRSPRHTLAC